MSRRPRHRQVIQNSVKNGKWGKAGIMNCQFRSRRALCNAVRSRANITPARTYDAIPNATWVHNDTQRNNGIRKIVDDWIAGGTLKADVVARYGPIEDWDTSLVTDMSYLFSGKSTFNADISKWNVSKVTNMTSMFDSAGAFDVDISKWNVENVTTMNKMFWYAESFNQNLSDWNPGKCMNFIGMFWKAFQNQQTNGSWLVSSAFAIALEHNASAVTPTLAHPVTNHKAVSFFSTDVGGGQGGDFFNLVDAKTAPKKKYPLFRD
jgi:surface protein